MRIRISRLRPVVGLVVIGLAASAVVAVACGDSDGGAGIASGERDIYLAAVEYKGSTELEKEPFPTTTLPSGTGWKLKDPKAFGDPLKWGVESYTWAPSTIVVAEGDEVTLHILGINGAQHASEIEGHNVKFTVKRGEVTTVKFTAGEAGVYEMICRTHAPSMTGQLIVLGSSS